MSERSTAEPRTWEVALQHIASAGCEDGDYGDGLCGCWPCYAQYVLDGGDAGDGPVPVQKFVELSHYLALEAALKVAADDLGKAANQFASMRESQRAGHTPEVRSNPELFGRKEARARAALASAGAGGPDDG